MTMIRTQIYLPKSLYQNISLIAKREKKPKAAVIRSVLEEMVEEKLNKESLGETLNKLIEAGKQLSMNGPTDLSTNHNKYLYE